MGTAEYMREYMARYRKRKQSAGQCVVPGCEAVPFKASMCERHYTKNKLSCARKKLERLTIEQLHQRIRRYKRALDLINYELSARPNRARPAAREGA